MKKSKGFTLVELMIVIVIIGILALVAVSSMTSYLKKERALREGRHVIEKVEPTQSNELKKLDIK